MKYIFILIGYLILLFVAVWVFNHINPWLGIFAFIAIIIHIIYYINNKTKKT